MIDLEKERERTGYCGKPQQWQYGFDIAMSIAQKAEAEKCVWRENEDGVFETACDFAFELNNLDYLSENFVKHCCYCGKRIEEVSFEESEDE